MAICVAPFVAEREQKEPVYQRLLRHKDKCLVLERVKGIEPSYSAWKSPNLRSVFNTHSDSLQLFGRLRLLQNFSLSEWSYETDERSPSLWKSVKYGRQRLYQQHGASAQHAGIHDEQGQDPLPKHLFAGDIIRIGHLCAPAFFVRRSPGGIDLKKLAISTNSSTEIPR